MRRVDKGTKLRLRNAGAGRNWALQAMGQLAAESEDDWLVIKVRLTLSLPSVPLVHGSLSVHDGFRDMVILLLAGASLRRVSFGDGGVKKVMRVRRVAIIQLALLLSCLTVCETTWEDSSTPIRTVGILGVRA